MRLMSEIYNGIIGTIKKKSTIRMGIIMIAIQVMSGMVMTRLVMISMNVRRQLTIVIRNRR